MAQTDTAVGLSIKAKAEKMLLLTLLAITIDTQAALEETQDDLSEAEAHRDHLEKVLEAKE